GWCRRFSPVVAVEEADEPASLFLDVTGCHVPNCPDEKAMARLVADELRRHGYWARVAVADTVGAARAVALYGTGPAPAGPVVVPPRGQREALRPLPVEALRLPRTVVPLLHSLDVRQVGQLLALPRSAL